MNVTDFTFTKEWYTRREYVAQQLDDIMDEMEINDELMVEIMIEIDNENKNKKRNKNENENENENAIMTVVDANGNVSNIVRYWSEHAPHQPIECVVYWHDAGSCLM